MRQDKPTPIAGEFADLHDEDLITIEQFSRLKKIGLNTAKRMVARGDLEVVQLSPRRVGIKMGVARRWQYRRAEVAA